MPYYHARNRGREGGTPRGNFRRSLRCAVDQSVAPGATARLQPKNVPKAKNKKYRDVLYVEELIGADTVDTIPPATFDAFRDHGKLRNSLTENVDAAAKTMSDLEKAGISMKEVTEKLVVDGVKLFAEAFDKLLEGTGKTAGVQA